MPEQKDNTSELVRFPNATGGRAPSPGTTSPEFTFGPGRGHRPAGDGIGRRRPSGNARCPPSAFDGHGFKRAAQNHFLGRAGQNRQNHRNTLAGGENPDERHALADGGSGHHERHLLPLYRQSGPPAGNHRPRLSLKWLDRLLQHSLAQKISALIDLGGGDTTLRRLAVELPDLVALFEAQGFAVVLFHTVGPQEEDLSPLATLQGLAFKPTASAIILNEAMMDVGETRDMAFARILRHSVVRHAIGEGAVPVFMPRLLAAQPVEIRRLKFHDAIAGKTGRADTPLGPFDRARVRLWLEAMDANFAGVSSWLP